MTPEFKAFVAGNHFCLHTVREAQKYLPADDAELSRWVEEAIASNEQSPFLWLLVAATSTGRVLEARHLASGSVLFHSTGLFGNVAWQMTGDVAGNLLQAVEQSNLGRPKAALALFLAACWRREKCPGQGMEDLFPKARMLARLKDLEPEAHVYLCGLLGVTGDAALRAVVVAHGGVPPEETLRRIGKDYMATWQQPVLELLPDKPATAVAAGLTMRRAVAKTGRNEPCPCGSGKKYKNCCTEKDQERLRSSTSVAGHTFQEFWTDPERHLTVELLKACGPCEFARFDPAKIPAELREFYLERLGIMRLYDRLAEAFEKLGCAPELEPAWRTAIRFATTGRRRDIVERLRKVRPGVEHVDPAFQTPTRLLMLESDPAAFLQELEGQALRALQSEDLQEITLAGLGLMMITGTPALGIFITRSLVPLAPREAAGKLFDMILATRDRLNLPPDDSYSDVMDKRYFEDDPDKRTEAIRASQERLEEKAKEVRQLKESLDALQRQMERREKTAETSAVIAPVAAPDEAALRELRGKVEALKSALKERHEERNGLRRELQQAHADLESLRENAAPASHEETTAADAEEALLLPEEESGSQPVRTIEFPKGFQEKLSSLPKSVARGTMTMLGRVAAGEPAAFVGAVRLKACPSVTRLRMGIDFRLLFRLLPDRVEVLDLIPRQDLERRIKTLVRTAHAA